MARPGAAWHGTAGRGAARRGKARQGDRPVVLRATGRSAIIASEAGMDVLLIGAVALVVNFVAFWFVVRSASRADDIVQRLEGINRRLDVIGKLAWDDAERQRQTGTPSSM